MTNGNGGSASDGGALSRREFLIALGVGAGAGIGGYFVFRRDRQQELPPTAATASASCPMLRRDLPWRREGDLYAVPLPNGSPGELCAVNDAGHALLSRFDGRHTIADLTTMIAQRNQVAHTDLLEARIAMFAAQVGQAGLLETPFYAQIYEHRVGS